MALDVNLHGCAPTTERSRQGGDMMIPSFLCVKYVIRFCLLDGIMVMSGMGVQQTHGRSQIAVRPLSYQVYDTISESDRAATTLSFIIRLFPLDRGSKSYRSYHSLKQDTQTASI